MKIMNSCTLASIIFLLVLSGCTFTREPMRFRDDYFRPVPTVPQKSSSALSSNDLEQLGSQLHTANQRIAALLDSLKSMQSYTMSLLVSTHTLVDKVTELESKDFLAIYKQKELEQSVAALQTENKYFSQQLEEVRKKLFAGNGNAEPQVFSPAGITAPLRDEYAEGVSLFKQKKFSDALATFSGLLDKGIEESLVDNCEYWIGECQYATHDFRNALTHFQKVLTMDSANKKLDAYFMLGKSYEQIGDGAKARWAYEELSLLYPGNIHSRYVKSRLNAIKQALPVRTGGRQKKTST